MYRFAVFGLLLCVVPTYSNIAHHRRRREHNERVSPDSEMDVPLVSGYPILGRAFDFHSMEIRPFQIFDESSIQENLRVIETPEYHLEYTVATSNADVRKFLGIHPYFALKVALHDPWRLRLYGNFLKNKVKPKRTVEVLVLLKILKETKSFDYNHATLTETWQKRPADLVGTHFINQIHYGGILLASVEFHVSKPEHYDTVVKTIAEKLSQHGIDGLKDIHEALGDKVSFTSLKTSSAPVPHRLFIGNIDTLLQVIKEFPNLVNREHGTPISFGIVDIHSVYQPHKSFVENNELVKELGDFASLYDDIRVATDELNDFVEEEDLNSGEEEMVYDYMTSLEKVRREFMKTIHTLDVTKPTDQLANALQLYWQGGEHTSRKYYEKLQKLRKQITNQKDQP